MKIAIAGSHGFIGQKLVQKMRHGGHSVKRIVRDIDQKGIFWSPQTNYINPNNLESFDAIINLCGNKITSFNPLFVREKELKESRILTNLLLSRIIAKLNNPPTYFISASACSIYNPSSSEKISEEDSMGRGFLAQMALEWEEASRFYETPNTNVVNLRLGHVISEDSFFLNIMKFLVKNFKIKSLGNGNQIWPWVSMEDVLSIFEFILNSNHLEGPFNIVSPEQVSSEEFLSTLASILNKKVWFKVPRFIMNMFTNTLASQILLESYPITPRKLIVSNYSFINPSLESTFSKYLN